MRGIEWQAAEALPPPTPKTPADERPALALPVAFETGQASVSRGSWAYVAAVAEALRRDPQLKIQVEGHTDAAGAPRVNLMLSWERAFAVFRMLVERHGIDPARLVPVGKGASEPLVETSSPHPLNRRVQFRVMSL